MFLKIRLQMAISRINFVDMVLAQPGFFVNTFEFDSWGIGVCVANFRKLVIYQNNSCKNICGRKVPGSCHETHFASCTSRHLFNSLAEGTYREINYIAGDQKYDLMIVNGFSHVITIIVPVNRTSEDQVWYSEFGLTAKEQALVKLLFERQSNKQISEELELSLSTVKWHIRNIYKKLPFSLKQTLKKIRGDRL